MSNDEIYARIVSLRQNDPQRYAFTKIHVAFENAENKAVEIRKKGKSQYLLDQFLVSLTQIKTAMKSAKHNFGLTNPQIISWCDEHGYDYKLRFNLSPISR